MRQAGLKPKNHNSGVYWTRAASGNGKHEEQESTVSDLLLWAIVLPIFVVIFPFIWLNEKLKK